MRVTSQVLGEGTQVDEKDIAIQIQDLKVFQWLSSRKVISSDWKASMPRIQKAFEDLKARLPEQVELPNNRGLYVKILLTTE